MTECPAINQEQFIAMYKRSITEPKKFWAEQAEKQLTWFKRWTDVCIGDFETLNVHWFNGGKLNACYNCLDRHLEKHAQTVAFFWEGDNPEENRKITYADLYDEVCRFANVLKKMQIKKGDRICIYMPMVPEVLVAMLACARIGAVHSVVFGGFSADAVRDRVLDANCRLVITANEGIRANKVIPLKTNLDKALTACPKVEKVIVVKRTANSVAWDEERDVWYHEAIKNVSNKSPCEMMDASDPLFILYTSGSTGKPKGIVHTTGGYLVYVASTFQYVFNYQLGDVYWCTADVGWVTGHSYLLYGPLINGATSVVFEGVPSYPSPARCWEIVDKYQVNIFYTAPTAIRALRSEGDNWVKQTKRTSLKILGSVGEPINPEVWEWYAEVVGDNHCAIVDTWWQTETGGILISPLAGVTVTKPGSATKPFFGIVPKIVDDTGKEVEPDILGRLVITQPWPGMMHTVYNDRDRFVKTYFTDVPGCYLTGDNAKQDTDGDYWIVGRNDDVIKISGHRLGTGEIESAFLLHPDVAEVGVVAVPDKLKGEAIYAFVAVKADTKPNEALKKSLIQQVRDSIGAIATPKFIQWVDGLPKTRSGKIMRRLLRKIANNDLKELGDTSTLADPLVVENLIKNRVSEKTS